MQRAGSFQGLRSGKYLQELLPSDYQTSGLAAFGRPTVPPKPYLRLLCLSIVLERLAAASSFASTSNTRIRLESPTCHKAVRSEVSAYLIEIGRFDAPDSVKYEATAQGCTSAAASDTGLKVHSL
jgi:hypothetical protein